MIPTANAKNAVSEEPLKLEPFQPSPRIMDWTDEPATEDQINNLRRLGYHPVRPLTKTRAAHLLRSFEEHMQGERASAESGVGEITKREAHLLQQAFEEAGRAVQKTTKDHAEELRQILSLAMARRQDFWLDTCRDTPRMRELSAQVFELHLRYGCRFVVPSRDQVQAILSALDLLMPLWDGQHPEMFYQTLEANFPELDRLSYGSG